jgi:molybdopterin-guanine dinucleotide biosynthesis protein B
MVASDVRWALMHEMRDAPEESFEALLTQMAPADLLLVQGWKIQSSPKMEVYRKANGKPLLYPDSDHIIAIASDSEPETTLPRFGIDDYDHIAQFVLEWTGLR